MNVAELKLPWLLVVAAGVRAIVLPLNDADSFDSVAKPDPVTLITWPGAATLVAELWNPYREMAGVTFTGLLADALLVPSLASNE
jgi:hypothetical protein